MNDESCGTVIAATKPANRPSLSLVGPKIPSRAKIGALAEGQRSCLSDPPAVALPRSKLAMAQPEDQEVSEGARPTPEATGTEAEWIEVVLALQASQRLVQTDLKEMLRAQLANDTSVRRLYGCAHGYAEEADLLLLAMVRHGAPMTLIEVTEELFDFFRQAEEEIQSRLTGPTRRGP